MVALEGDMDHETAICPGCGEPRVRSDFPARSKRCVHCRRATVRKHYRANRAYYIAKARRRTDRVVRETRAWLLTYLREHPCVDCGNGDIRVLEFDHRDGSTKVRAVALLAGQGYSLTRVRAEIEKCQVRCANCHRIRTHVQLGWWGKDMGLDV